MGWGSCASMSIKISKGDPMKNKFTRLLCLILTLAMLASMFTVFVAADESTEEEDPYPFRLVINRTYDEGWDYTNGMSNASKSNNFYIDSEVDEELNRNYFFRLEALNGNDGYSELNLSKYNYPDQKHMYLEFDLKVDDYVDLKINEGGVTCSGTILYDRTKGGSSTGKTTHLLGIDDGKLFVLNDTNASTELTGEWVHIVVHYDYSQEDLAAQYKSNVTVSVYDRSGSDLLVEKTATKGLTQANYGLDIFRFGFANVTGDPSYRVGMSYCLDNLKFYINADGPTDITLDEHGYGESVDLRYDKSIEIEGSDSGSSSGYYMNDSLVMKLNVNYALHDKVRTAIYDGEYGAPVKINGTIYVPLEMVLKHVGTPYYVHEDGESYDISSGDSASYITIGREVATVDGQLVQLEAAPGYATALNGKQYPVIAMNDVETLFPGQYVTYDDMGIMIICGMDNVYNRYSHLTTLMTLMKQFCFELPSDTELLKDVTETTDNFQHPYLIVKQETLDYYASVWTAEEGDENYDEFLLAALQTRIRAAEKYYKKYSLPYAFDENGVEDYSQYVSLDYAQKDLYQPYLDENFGYDPAGGRLNETESRGNEILELAFAYHITGDIKYFLCAYDFFLCMGEWTHWGPGHFLDVADGAAPMSIAFDILYNKIVEMGETNPKYDVKTIADIFYKHVMLVAYDTVMGIPCRFPRKQGYVSFYNTMVNNWNAVCTSGVVMSSLVIMEFNSEYNNYPAYIAADNLYTLIHNGMGQYAPDGSYVESPGYWAYGTNCLYRMLACLENAAGDTYGIFNCWGLDKTCYFALQAESSDYRVFNYHDGGMGQMDHTYFFYVGRAMNDPALITLRMREIHNGKTTTMTDLFFYPDEEIDYEVEVELPLDYYMEGIDAAVSRSSWEKGAMYVGMIGGYNSASHGQIDSGDFVYHNAGRCWIQDLGADDYNVYGYFSGPDNVRYRYYKMNSEGNNTLALTSDGVNCWGGQVLSARGVMSPENWYSNEHGSYAIIDQTAVYASNVVSAYRGMFVTNDRKTVVIQDEVSMNGVQSMVWNAHFENSAISTTLSKDKKTAYLVQNDGTTLRLTLVSPVKSFRFRLVDTYEFFLNSQKGTVGPTFSVENQGVQEHDRSKFSKLVIEGTDILSFKVAVVIEIVDRASEVTTGYSWTDMNKWMPYADTRGDDEVVVETATRGAAKNGDIKAGAVKMRRYVDGGTAFDKDFSFYYRALTDVQYAIEYLEYKEIPSSLQEDYQCFLDCKASYDAYYETVKERVTATGNLVGVSFGF